MNPDNLPKPENEPYIPNLDAQDEDVAAGGSNRLLYGLLAVVLVLVLGYVALPKGKGGVVASATPSFMLDDAAVTATAAKPVVAPESPKAEAEAQVEEKSVKNPKSPTRSATDAASAKPVPAALTATAAVAPAPVAAPEPAPAAPVAPEPATPASVTLSGKIDDENGRPLVGATVFLKGSRKGTSTDASGHYTIEVPAGNDNTLVYGYGGYDDEIVRSRNNEPINVTLTPREKVGKKHR